MKRILVSLFIMSIFTASVFAADVLPPDWRNADGTTYQQWDFASLQTNPIAPDVIVNDYGSANACITLGDFGEGWMDNIGLGTQTGIWDMGQCGNITMIIDNRPLPLEYKEISIQVTYYQSITAAPTIDVTNGQFVTDQAQLLEADGVLGAWYVLQSTWRIYPNPECEQIVITSAQSGSLIDQIIVDTICIPEPMTVAILGLGALLLRRRK